MFSKKISLFVLPFIAMSLLQASDPFLNDPFGDAIFKEMYQMQKDMDKIFERMHQRMEQRTTQQWYSPTLIPNNSPMTEKSLLEDRGTYYEYNTQIKEGQNSQIDISIEDGILHFKATTDTKTKTEQSHMQTQQHYVGMIQRSQTLPEDADATTLKSEYKNGILVLTLEKIKSAKQPVVNENVKQEPTPVFELPKEEQEKKENNTTRIRVPHTSSHV